MRSRTNSMVDTAAPLGKQGAHEAPWRHMQPGGRRLAIMAKYLRFDSRMLHHIVQHQPSHWCMDLSRAVSTACSDPASLLCEDRLRAGETAGPALQSRPRTRNPARPTWISVVISMTMLNVIRTSCPTSEHAAMVRPLDCLHQCRKANESTRQARCCTSSSTFNQRSARQLFSFQAFALRLHKFARAIPN